MAPLVFNAGKLQVKTCPRRSTKPTPTAKPSSQEQPEIGLCLNRQPAETHTVTGWHPTTANLDIIGLGLIGTPPMLGQFSQQPPTLVQADGKFLELDSMVTCLQQVFLCFTFSYFCVCSCVCTHVCTCVSLETGSQCLVSYSITLHLLFRTGLLTKPVADQWAPLASPASELQSSSCL